MTMSVCSHLQFPLQIGAPISKTNGHNVSIQNIIPGLYLSGFSSFFLSSVVDDEIYLGVDTKI